MQQKCVPQKNSQNRRLLWEALVEGNLPSDSDLKMTSRGKFVHDRAKTPLPKHPSLDTQPSSTGRPLLGDPSTGQSRGLSPL
ncbi:hypothetical protein E2C01_050789 [Portunus trituberculatus]|uniref:Uncharacterized protein n=1 Tax=Portunus trituberculatus TaxID=210409 RepID=A0A5B7GHF0_PORTR|nr:hypothetical protein [Portunus trituberculatus]